MIAVGPLRWLMPAAAYIIPFVAPCSENWRGGGDATEASAAFVAYTNGTAGVVAVPDDGRNWTAALPFAIPVRGNAETAACFRATLEAAEAALPAEVREAVRAARAEGPYRQWLLRRARAIGLAAANKQEPITERAVERQYFSAAAQAPVFTSVDGPLLMRTARSLTAAALPPIACVRAVYGEFAANPIRRAVAGHDYPGVWPEEAVVTPLGLAIVLRAPERQRLFRFQARAAADGRPVEYRWQPLRGGVSIRDWNGAPGLSRQAGCAEVTVDARYAKPRADVIVCARVRGGLWGPPAVISFACAPEETRIWNSRGEIEEIRYPGWKDVYEINGKGVIVGFERQRADSFLRERFGFADERVYETWPDDSPRRLARVTYRLSASGACTYETSAETIERPRGATPPRDRGEFHRIRTLDARATHAKPARAH